MSSARVLNGEMAKLSEFWGSRLGSTLDTLLAVAGYALAIFCGAFLLFQVQPLMGKFILPWFGGGPGVWTVCLLFFQLFLLAGYAYAHVLSSVARPRVQAAIHFCLLLAALALLPIMPSESWKPRGGEAPTWRILALLMSSVGLPYFMLSATGPLLQRWLSRTRPGAVPYRLYALSNAASLLALVSYPFFLEPNFTRHQQVMTWTWGFVLYAVFCGACSYGLWKSNPGISAHGLANPPACGEQQDPTSPQKAFWFLLPFCASVLLLATTNKICQDIAVVPFLWILPLAAYLLSFIIAFDSPRWYSRVPFTIALVAALGGACWGLTQGTDFPVKHLAALYTISLFICCTVCHAEAYRLRPSASHLTTFYLAIAAGGAAGGVFVAVLAPLLFDGYYELHWGLFLCGLLFLALCAKDWDRVSLANPFQALQSADGMVNQPWRGWKWIAVTLSVAGVFGMDWELRHAASSFHGWAKACFGFLRFVIWILFVAVVAVRVFYARGRPGNYWRLLTCLWLLLGLAALGTALWREAWTPNPDVIHRNRNFYGTLTVYDHQRDDPLGRYLLLQHGGITHGIQFQDRDQAIWATTYYCKGSGLAAAMEALPENARRMGVVGLGTGSIAVYAKPGDYLRFYEINPEIRRLAMDQFTYLADCRGVAEVVLGDARLSMEREIPQEFDLLALDAFSGDAIPAHLLTREAFLQYDRHLRPNGIIAVHISNHYLDLEPVVVNLAKEFRFELARVDFDEQDEWWNYASTWILLSRSREVMSSAPIQNVGAPLESKIRNIPLWTDDFTSLYQILK